MQLLFNIEILYKYYYLKSFYEYKEGRKKTTMFICLTVMRVFIVNKSFDDSNELNSTISLEAKLEKKKNCFL